MIREMDCDFDATNTKILMPYHEWLLRLSDIMPASFS